MKWCNQEVRSCALFIDPSKIRVHTTNMAAIDSNEAQPEFLYSEEEKAIVVKVAQETREVFPPGRTFSSPVEIRNELRIFGNDKGFCVTSLGSSLYCTRAAQSKSYIKRMAKKSPVPLAHQRKRTSTRCGCTFRISFTWVDSKNKQHNKAIKVTGSSQYSHDNGCVPSKETVTGELKKSGGLASEVKKRLYSKAMNYAAILYIPRNASQDEVQKAYKKLSLQWHPDNHADKCEQEQQEAQEKFRDVAEAYDVLSHAERRAILDRYGEQGLKLGGPPPRKLLEDDDGAEVVPPNYPLCNFGSTSPHGLGYHYAVDPRRAFANFIRGINQHQRSFGEVPFEGMGGLEETVFGGGPQGQALGGSKRHRRTHLPERVCGVSCTLEELYNGTMRRMKVTRKSLTEDRSTEVVLEVHVRPGFKAGTRITFSGQGDEIQPGLAEDIVFVIRELQHPRFVREGDDLHLEIRVPLVESLCGFTHEILMLDAQQRTKQLILDAPVNDSTTKVFAGEGMPLSNEPDKRGYLIVTFFLQVPTNKLSDEQKEHIRKALG